jgi:hypothetical protein
MIYTCNHLNPHSGPLSSDPKEVAWRTYLRNSGWLRQGYCFHYYPKWLRRAWEKFDWPITVDSRTLDKIILDEILEETNRRNDADT